MDNELQLQESGLVYVQVRERLLNRISKMKPGDKLPSERMLSTHFKVARATVGRAIESLEKEGFVVRHQGRGTFVKQIFKSENGTSTEKGMLAVVIPVDDLPCHSRILASIRKEAEQRGYQLLVCNSNNSTSQEKYLLDDLQDENLTGILVYPLFEDSMSDDYASIIRKLEESGKKIVLLDQYVPMLRTRAVLTNYAEVGYIATEHLISMGHSKICYVSTGGFDVVGQAAINGYKSALHDNGIPFQDKLLINIPIQYCAEPTKEAVKKLLLTEKHSVTAIATSHFSMTHGIMNALAELKLRVCQDIAVVGCDTFQNPALEHVTHMEQQFEEIGRIGVELLVKEQDALSLKSRWFISPKLVIGDTCGLNRNKNV